MYFCCEHPPKTKDSIAQDDGVARNETMIMRRETREVNLIADMFFNAILRMESLSKESKGVCLMGVGTDLFVRCVCMGMCFRKLEKEAMAERRWLLL